MKEGWHRGTYLILFDDDEIGPATRRYGLDQSLTDFRLIGLESWDNFLVRNARGLTFSVPTLPHSEGLLQSVATPQPDVALEPDSRFAGKVKWYVKPLAFGGDVRDLSNVHWVDHDQHAQLVRWWNDKHRQLQSQLLDA